MKTASVKTKLSDTRKYCLDKLSDWHTGVLSLMIHSIVVALFGGIVLYRSTEPPPDFVAQAGFLEAKSKSASPPDAPNISSSPLSMPDVSLLSASEPLSAISTVNAISPSFVVPVTSISLTAVGKQMIANASNALQKSAQLVGSGGGLGGGGGAGSGEQTAFGSRGGRQEGLIGTFYDLKKNRDGDPTDMAESEAEMTEGREGMAVGGWEHSPQTRRFVDVLKEFVEEWRPRLLSQYFKASAELATYQINISNIAASEAPHAFRVEKNSRPRRWVVHYKGKIVSPKDTVCRFIGFGDDILVVRIDQQNVLDACYGTQILDPMARVNDAVGSPLIAGTWITMRRGQTMEMEVLVGEGPGGGFNAVLLVDEKGANNATGDYPMFQIRPTDGVYPSDDAGKRMLFDTTRGVNTLNAL